MSMMTSEIQKFVGFQKKKKQISKYLKKETFFLLQINEINSLCIKSCFMANNSFLAEATLKQ